MSPHLFGAFSQELKVSSRAFKEIHDLLYTLHPHMFKVITKDPGVLFLGPIKLVVDPNEVIHAGPLRYEALTGKFFKNDEEFALTPKQTEIMVYFMMHPEQLLDFKSIQTAVWGRMTAESLHSTRQYLRVQLGPMRELIEPEAFIESVPGLGYKLVFSQGEAPRTSKKYYHKEKKTWLKRGPKTN